MVKNQKGFSHALLLLFLLAWVLICALAIIGLEKKSSGTASSPANGSYAAKNFDVSFGRESDDNFLARYPLTVYYDDSFDPKSVCPAQLPNFKGSLKIHYLSDSQAKIDALQNIKPQSGNQGGSTVAACPAVVVPSYDRSLTLDKKWVENSSPDKTLQVNAKTYHLTLNKSERTISFWGPNKKTQTQPYLPDGIALLYAHRMYEDCMTITQLEAYAKEHGIVTADSKYPGLTAQIRAVVGKHDNSNIVLFVIADDYVKQLAKNASQEKYTEVCSVLASKPVGIY